jgi:class 3 adenylate cyclase/predicted ATPase
MTFEEILDQAIAMVQRRGRVTYRTLKLQFALDDEQLATLKDELLYSQPHVVDDAACGLLWTGARERPTDSPPSVPSVTSASPPGQPTLGAFQPAERTASDAERRQLTVMFCDLVDSTKLSSQLDPEDYRDVVRAYQTACTAVIQRYDGHIAQLLGDGLLVYFGYPLAHEDDAHRAVRTGLGILKAMEDLNQGLQQAPGIQLALRMGIHTGLVVVGAMGSTGRQEQLALGETPNVAARMQGLATPNTVAISDATYRLVQGYFQCQELGAHALRGVPEAMRLYHVLRESGASSRLDVAQPRGLTPLVGRESEVTLLLERWEQAKAGHGQVVLLSGDGGIGKSRLVQTLKDHVANEPHVRWECRSVPYYQNTALYPLTDLLQRTLQWQHDETSTQKLGKLEQTLSQYRLPLEETVPLFASLLSVPMPENLYPPLHLSPQRQRQKTLQTIAAILLELAEHQPILFILEDLHWTDPTTLELLNLLIDQTPTASMLVLLTSRPHFQPSWHHRSYLTEMTVHRLSPVQVAQIVTRMTDGQTLPQEVLQQILGKTDGIPLFVEEVTKAILESGQLKAVDGHYEFTGSLRALMIPATLQDSLMARLDRLVTAKAVAQYAAAMGRQFAYDLLLMASQLDEATLQRELGRLVEAEIVYQRGLPPQATYMFKHALIQDAAYQSLLKSTRQQYHQRIAQVLEAEFPATAEAQPELLAHHYTEAGLIEKAVRYWYHAGQRASERSAHLEAISHLTRGLEVLTTVPETSERLQQELDIQIALVPAWMVIKGYGAPEVEHACARARELCQQVGNTSQLFLALQGMWRYSQVAGALQTAQELAEQLLQLAQSTHDSAHLLVAHWALSRTYAHRGELVLAREHAQQGQALYNPQQHGALALRYGFDPSVTCLSQDTVVLWLLGAPDQALAQAYNALTMAQELAHPPSLVYAQFFVTFVHQLRCEPQVAGAQAEALVALCMAHGLALYLATGTIFQGEALAAQGQPEEAMVQIQQGLAALQATGAVGIWCPYFLTLLAEASAQAGQSEEGERLLAEAQTLLETTGERWWEAEVHRLRGELRWRHARAEASQVETYFLQALAVACRQQTKSLELRAAMSLARLWQQQGKRTEAHELLAPIYGWFTEGFDTADLQEAKALLETLA